MKSLFLQLHKKITLISRTLLIFFVFSFFTHGAHFDLIAETTEQQECHLCQHHIDSPNVSPLFSGFETSLFIRISVAALSPALSVADYRFPPLRGPPSH